MSDHTLLYFTIKGFLTGMITAFALTVIICTLAEIRYRKSKRNEKK